MDISLHTGAGRKGEQQMKMPEGLKIRCSIEGHLIEEAVIRHEGNNTYICQNHCCGQGCRDKKGYSYSWVIKNDLENPGAGVTNIRY